MPLYVYRCRDCGSLFERRQSFHDLPLSQCESCGGHLYKVLQPATVIYKGSGFYSTDYRSKSGGNGRNGGHADKEAVPKASEESGKSTDKAVSSSE